MSNTVNLTSAMRANLLSLHKPLNCKAKPSNAYPPA